jgi:acyl-CoA thioesterase
MGVAQYFLLDAGATSATLEIQIRYLRPVTEGAPICNARVIKKGSRVIFLDAEVTLDGDIVATATGSYAVTRSRA